MTHDYPDSAPTPPSRWTTVAAVVACVLTVLWVTPWAPAMPVSGVDGSWGYAMNVAMATSLRFGSDIVFTFGPLASVYTGVYHPVSDPWMIAASVLIAIALFAGCWAIVPASKRHHLLLLPLVIALIWSADWDGWRDALFLFLPLLLPWVIDAGHRRQRPYTGVVCLLAMATALLPLVKGNLTLLVGLSTVTSLVLSWRTARRTAALLLLVQCLTLVVVWCAVGQRLVDLPTYFIAQLPLVSGYTDAMAATGPVRDVILYCMTACLLLGIAMLTGLCRHAYVVLLIGAYLFVAFKSGFVRHDEQHAVVAAAALLLTGMLIHFGPGSGAGRGPVAMLLGLVGWAAISAPYVPLTGPAAVARWNDVTTQPLRGAWSRITQPDALSTRYRESTERLGARPPFTASPASSDVYPWDLTPLLASGARWKPRPVVQGYAAITPALIERNARHLEQDGPARVYFGVNPIDGRYPALEDGRSWLTLLAAYAPKTVEAGYAVLDRKNAVHGALVPGPATLIEAKMGSEVDVVGWEQPVWVTLDITPTVAGRLATALYKSPRLSLKVRYENGETAEYRMVAGMARSGFLLSPTVTNADEYVALMSDQRHALMPGRRVVAMGVFGGSGTRLLWKGNYRIAFARLDIPPSVEASRALLGEWRDASPPETFKMGGHCSIDDVGASSVASTPSPLPVPEGPTLVRGWAALNGPEGHANEAVSLLVGSADKWRLLPARRVARSDVAAYFQQPGLEYSGFEAYLEPGILPSIADVRVIQEDRGRQLLCESARIQLRRTPDPSR